MGFINTQKSTGQAINASHWNYIQDKINERESGWIELATTITPTYASATTFTVTGNYSNLFAPGTKIKCINGGTKFFYAIATSFSDPTLTVTVTGGSDYSLASGSITDMELGKGSVAPGFPYVFNYYPSYTGFSVDPPTVAKFMLYGRDHAVVWIKNTADGTSNSTSKTFTLPVAAYGWTHANGFIPVARDNGADSFNNYWYMGGGTTTAYVFKGGGGNWTASGACRLFGGTYNAGHVFEYVR